MSSFTSGFRTSFSGLTNRIAFLLLATVCVLLFSSPLFSQGNFGQILGTVTDQSGGVVSGATVTIIDKDRGVARTLTTDQAGEYNAPTLIPGAYTVRVEANGFKRFERQNVELGVGKEVRVDATVQPGEQNQTITVTEAVPLVETTNATLGGTLSNSQINDLPLNGRNYQNLMALRPGVMIQPGGSPWTQSTNNIRPDENGWMVDGVISVNFFDARPNGNSPSAFTDAATVVPIDAIQEFNLEENPKAEYGWKPGAVVNVGIRSGTNNLHGTAYAFGRDQALDARNLFNPAPVNGVCQPNPAFLSACDKLPTQLKQFGGTVGGPIKKDKLFFFAGYEGYRSFIGNAFVTNLPETASQVNNPSPGSCPAGVVGDCANSMVDAIRALQSAGVARSVVSEELLGCTEPTPTTASCTGGLLQGQAAANTINYLSSFPNNNVSDNGIAKIDYAINSKHRIAGMLWIGNYTATGQDHPIASPLWETGIYERPMTTVENWIWTPSSTVVNEFRFGYNRGGQQFTIGDQGLFADGSGGLCTATGCGGKGYPLNTGVTRSGGLPQINVGFGAGGATLGNPNSRPDIQAPNPYWDAQDSVSYLLGKHALKFGGEFARIEADRNLDNYRGQINFLGGNTINPAFSCTPPVPGCSNSSNLEDFFAGNPSNGLANVGNQAMTVTWRKYAGFVQDDWRIVPKLMINLGLRYEYTSPLREVNNLFGNFDPTLGPVQQGQASVGNTIYKPDYKDLSPRLGFAYDVTGKGTTVVRGGASIIYSSYFAQQFTDGPQNGANGGLASVAQDATGASCTPNLNGCPASGNLGGTITAGQPIYSGSTLNWDPTVNPTPGRNGGLVYPSVALNCAALGSCSLRGVNPNLKTPYMVNYNLGVQHTITSNLSLELGYVGNHGGNLLGQQDINQCEHPFVFNTNGTCIRPYNQSCPVTQGGLGTGSLPCFSYLSFINMTENYARSNYNSLQATLTERATHGLNFTAGYTYGHGLDNGSLNRFGANLQDSTRPDLEYGNSDFDIRHRLTLTASYAIPGKKGFGQLLEGWKLNTILTVQSSQPWSIYDTQNAFSMGNAAGKDPTEGEVTDRWDFFGNPKDFQPGTNSIPFCNNFPADFLTSGGTDLTGVTCSTTSGISTLVTTLPSSLASACKVAPDITTLTAKHGGCFVDGNSVLVPPALGTFGTMGRNIFRDLGFKNLDFSIFKDFSWRERFGAEFRVEIFNIFNTTNLANPYGASTNGNLGDDPSKGGSFGCGCATPDVSAGNPLIGSGSNRVMQLGLKLSF